MKPRAFEYLRAGSLSDVHAAFAAHGEDAMILAGGQNVVPAMNMRLAEPTALVDINGIEGLDRIERDGDLLRIGALCRHETVRRSETVARLAPLLPEALAHVAHPAIRNRGTLGGSLCNADPSAELPACMLALGATFTLCGPDGAREVAAENFFLGMYETCLEPGEILTTVTLSCAGADDIQFFDEIARRRGDYALAGLAATARCVNGIAVSARFAFLSCGDSALLAPSLSALVQDHPGRTPDESQIAQALRDDLDPPQDAVTSSETRLHLAGVLARRAIEHFNGEGAA